MRESVRAIIAEIGIEYWRRVMKEFIEEGRRGQLLRTQQLTVPGIYRGHTFYGHVTEGKPGFQPLGPSNWLSSGFRRRTIPRPDRPCSPRRFPRR